MAFHTATATLDSLVSRLVLSVSQDGQRFVGESEDNQREVVSWIERIAQGDLAKDLKDLNALLLPKTYLVGYFTAADVALFGILHPVYTGLQPSQYLSHPAVTRYFDHIQSTPVLRASITSLGKAYDTVLFDLSNAPKQPRTASAVHKKGAKMQGVTVSKAKAGKEVADAASTSTATSVTDSTNKNESVKKKGVPSGKTAAKVSSADDSVPSPSMIDLRVGQIVDIIKHPDADGLYIEQIDIGEETGPRTVVSGLVNYIPIEHMRDKYLVAVCNLKPANMRGVKSFAMVLCATSKDGKEGGIELIQPPPNSKPGDRVYFEGAEFEGATPLAQLNPKKKIFEVIQPGFITLDTKEAAWINPDTQIVHRIRTKDGVCVAPTLVGASLS